MGVRAGRPTLIPRHAVGVELRDLGDPGDGGNILGNQSGYVRLVTAGAETRTLDDPTFEGQELLLIFETDGGDCVITSDSAVNQAGNNTITFSDAGEFLLLVGARDGAGGYEWRRVAGDGDALSTV